MKWLLLTGIGNPGDEWAKLGVAELIRSVDPKARLWEVDKLVDDIKSPLPVDNVVFCGQPLVWSHATHDTTKIQWWGPLNGWMSQKCRLILAGFGTYLKIPQHTASPLASPEFCNQDRVMPDLKKLFSQSKAAYCRESLSKTLFNPPVMNSACPSVFAGRHFKTSRDLDLCSFMPNGAHYAGFDKARHEAWVAKRGMIAAILRDAGFVFMAHDAQEEHHGLAELGWPKDRLVSFKGDAAAFLAVYARGRRYFGNRIHGGIVSRGFGSQVLVCGYDSRLRAITDLGGDAILPESINADFVRSWLSKPMAHAPVNLEKLFREQQEFFRSCLAK